MDAPQPKAKKIVGRSYRLIDFAIRDDVPYGEQEDDAEEEEEEEQDDDDKQSNSSSSSRPGAAPKTRKSPCLAFKCLD